MDAKEFRSMWKFLRGDGEELREIRNDFDRLDKDKNGFIW